MLARKALLEILHFGSHAQTRIVRHLLFFAEGADLFATGAGQIFRRGLHAILRSRRGIGLGVFGGSLGRRSRRGFHFRRFRRFLVGIMNFMMVHTYPPETSLHHRDAQGQRKHGK